MLFFGDAGRAQRQPRRVRTAMPSALLPHRRSSSPLPAGRGGAEPEGQLSAAPRSAAGCRRGDLAQDRGAHEAPGICRRRHGAVPCRRTRRADRPCGARPAAKRVLALRLYGRLPDRAARQRDVRHAAARGRAGLLRRARCLAAHLRPGAAARPGHVHAVRGRGRRQPDGDGRAGAFRPRRERGGRAGAASPARSAACRRAAEKNGRHAVLRSGGRRAVQHRPRPDRGDVGAQCPAAAGARRAAEAARDHAARAFFSGRSRCVSADLCSVRCAENGRHPAGCRPVAGRGRRRSARRPAVDAAANAARAPRRRHGGSGRGAARDVRRERTHPPRTGCGSGCRGVRRTDRRRRRVAARTRGGAARDRRLRPEHHERRSTGLLSRTGADGGDAVAGADLCPAARHAAGAAAGRADGIRPSAADAHT